MDDFTKSGKEDSTKHHSVRYHDDPTPILVTPLKKKNWVLRYNRLRHNIFTDRMQAGTVSRRMN